jgi:hypothetical protein
VATTAGTPWPSSGKAGNIRLTATPECAESKECHAPKHHYDECVERVTGQIENDGKASEDCVEECTPSYCPHATQPTNKHSLPSRPLRDPMRCAQALRSAQVNLSQPTTIARRIRRPHPRLDADSTLLNLKDRDDTSWMTVNTEVLFRITVLFPQCQAKPSCHALHRINFVVIGLAFILLIIIRFLARLKSCQESLLMPSRVLDPRIVASIPVLIDLQSAFPMRQSEPFDAQHQRQRQHHQTHNRLEH